MTTLKQLEQGLKKFAEQASSIHNRCKSEAQTKASLISPYLELLGYKINDPSEVALEYNADFAKGNEKVDYALHPCGEPTVLIEAKSASRELSKESPGQLQRYFIAVEAAEYAAYTNGLHWHWYRAIPGKQRLEQQPLLSIDVTEPRSSELDFLYHVSKDYFDLSRLNEIAEEIVATRKCLQWMKSAKSSPLDEFIRSMSKEIWGNTPKPSATVIRNALINVLNQKSDADNIEGNATEQYDHDRKKHSSERSAHPSTRKVRHKGFSQNHIAENWKQLMAMIRVYEKSQRPISTEEVFLDTEGSGPPLSSKKTRRAWRKKGGQWRILDSGRHVQIEVLNYLASIDERGKQPYFRHIIKHFDEILLCEGTEKFRYRKVQPNVLVFIDLTNPGKLITLAESAKHVKTSDNHVIRVGDDPEADIQVWLPFMKNIRTDSN